MKRQDIKILKLNDLKNYDKNPRVLKQNDLEKLKQSLRKFGNFGLLVVDENNRVIAGNQRLKAMKELGIDETEVKVLVGYTEEELKAINIRDNTHEGDFDEDMLIEILKTLDNETLNLVGIDDGIINSVEIEMDNLVYEDTDDYYLANDLEDEKPKDLNLTITFDSEDVLEQTRTDLIELSNEFNTAQAELLNILLGYNKEKTKDILRESNIDIIETLE